MHNHCYEAVDIDGMVRVRRCTSGHECSFADLSLVDERVQIFDCRLPSCARNLPCPRFTQESLWCLLIPLYLNLNILTFMIGGPPAIALFATNARYKREAYRGSEFSPAILADHGLKVVMKVRFSIQYLPYLTFVSFRVIIPS